MLGQKATLDRSFIFLIIRLHVIQKLLPRALVYRYETVVSKKAVVQVHFRVTKYDIADYIALNLPYSTVLFLL